MNVVAVQLDIAWHDKRANHEKVRGLLERAKIPKNSLIVLPEMFATGFSMEVQQVTDDLERATEKFVHKLSEEFQACVIAGIVSSRENGKGANEALVTFPDGNALRYQKMHPFTLGGESDNYVAGQTVKQFVWEGFKISPFVCYDLRFPEIFRMAALGGTEVIAVIANWPCAREEHWLTLLRARAIENQCYVIGVNRSGKDPKFPYPGRTQIIGPKGGVIVDAGAGEGVISAPLSHEALVEYRKDLPFLKDIRPHYLGRAHSGRAAEEPLPVSR